MPAGRKFTPQESRRGSRAGLVVRSGRSAERRQKARLLAAQGRTAQEIAEEMGMSLRTIYWYLKEK